ncbi:MAG TPA: SpoIIE family protein phosphatase, partial [Rubrobacter sp.]|nr:SpoIIE family protein phosphatase [Rubrobacter sp.]
MQAGSALNGRPPQDGAESRRLRRAAVLVLLFNVLLVAWVLLKPGGDRLLALVVNAAQFVGPLLALTLCFGGLLGQKWRRGESQRDVEPAVTIRQRWAPILLGMGILSWVLGQTIFTYYEWVLRQPPPLPSIADVGYLSVYPFLLLGILLLPARPIPVASRARIALDGLMTMTAAVTFSWYFVLGPVMQQGTETTLAKAVSSAYPLADIVLIACLVILASRPGERTLRPAIRLLALGLILIVVADSNFAYWSLHDAYATGTLPDVGWSLGYMLVALGAFAARLAPTGESTTTPDEQGDTPCSTSPLAERLVWPSLLPYVLVPAVGILAIYAWRTSGGSGSLATGVYVGGALLICLMLLRQVLTIVENARLYNSLQGTYLEMEKKEEEVRQLNRDLEKRVAERTEQLKSAMAKQQEVAQERKRIEQELRVARMIQHTLLPKSLPELEGHQIAVYYQPAREVGGDFYDFLELEDGRLGLVVGDASDKGIPAAMVMANTRSVLRTSAQGGDLAPGQVLAEANEILFPDIPPNMFVTCFYAILDPKSGRLSYANAGHDLPYLHRNGDAEELRARGMPLGLMPGMIYEEKEVVVDAGESVLFYSDGLVEAHDPKGEMFGFPRLRALVAEHDDEEKSLVDFLLDELYSFTGEGWDQEDDITLVTLGKIGGTLTAPRSSTRQTLAELSLPSEPGNERQATQEVARTVSGLGLPERTLERLKTAVAEATMNAMEHGNRYIPEVPVKIEVWLLEKRLLVRIIDRGGSPPPSPNATEVPDLEAKLEGMQTPRGWGLFLIKNMVDEVRVSGNPDHHTVELV